MKKQRYKLSALLLVLCLALLCLTGCGSKSADSSSEAAYEYSEDMPAEAPVAEPEETAEEGFDSSAASAGTGAAQTASGTDLSEKIIYSGYLYIETTAFDDATDAVARMVEGCGGFIESSNVYGSTEYQSDGSVRIVNRSADYVLRVPCGSFQSFMQSSSNLGNVLSSNTSADNITSQFTDTEARKQSLEVQEERLLAMMEQTTDVESLIDLEDRLSQVRYEIDSLERQLINWQNSVDYSTITLNICEVEVYTPVVERTRTFSERLGAAFGTGWDNFKHALASLLIGLVAIWPALLVLAIVVIVIIVLVRRSRKRRAARYAARYQAVPPQTPPSAGSNQPEPPEKP